MSDGPSPILAIDTSTHRSVVALRRGDGTVVANVADVGRRHGPVLLEQVDALLAAAALRPTGLARIVVGTGPGSFTGLRVGLATAKTLAYLAGVPLVGVVSSDALRHAAHAAGVAGPDAVIVLPAGARDHYLATVGQDPTLVPPGALERASEGLEVVAVGAIDAVGEDARQRGRIALDGLPHALIALGQAAADTGSSGVATLVPAYVALPRGVVDEGTGWSPGLRSA